eukprot:409354_1
MKSIVNAFKENGADVNYKVPGVSFVTMCQVSGNSGDIESMAMMVKHFDVELINARKRTQDVWFKFMDAFPNDFNKFVSLFNIYKDEHNKKELLPIHLIHGSKTDKDRRIQYKLYRVSANEQCDFTEKEKKLLNSLQNKKKK